MTEMRPDADSNEAGAQSEYGNDTGFAAEATRTADPEGDSAGDTGGLTAEDDEEPTSAPGGPGDGGD